LLDQHEKFNDELANEQRQKLLKVAKARSQFCPFRVNKIVVSVEDQIYLISKISNQHYCIVI